VKRHVLASCGLAVSLAAGAQSGSSEPGAAAAAKRAETAPPSPTPAQATPPSSPAPSLADVELAGDEELLAHLDIAQGGQALGRISIRLHHQYAPQHVRNFVRLAETGAYDGTLFHRIGPESFVQGGDPLSKDADLANDGTGGFDHPLQAEINEKKHGRGAVSSARGGGKENGWQFFISLKDHPEWDSEYTVFGNVTSGLEVADRIGAAKRKGDRPVEPISMQVTVEKRKKPLKLY
jgi:peptidyl-prolyl cis-trans isomerase B (cyclophilin B)